MTYNFFIWEVEMTVISLKVTERLNAARLCHVKLLFLWIKMGEFRVTQSMHRKCQSAQPCVLKEVLSPVHRSQIVRVESEQVSGCKDKGLYRAERRKEELARRVTKGWPKLPRLLLKFHLTPHPPHSPDLIKFSCTVELLLQSEGPCESHLLTPQN